MSGGAAFKRREELILDAAHQRLLGGGYAAMNLDELARDLGIGKATLYKHFASKEDLAAAVVAAQMARAEAMEEALPPSLTPLQRLEAMLTGGLRGRLTMNPTAMGLPVDTVYRRPVLVAAQARAAARVAAILRAAREAGELREDLPEPFLVAWVANLFGSGIDYVQEMTGLPPEAVARHVVDVFLRGIVR